MAYCWWCRLGAHAKPKPSQLTGSSGKDFDQICNIVPLVRGTAGSKYTFNLILQVFQSDFTISAPRRARWSGVQKLALSVKIWNRSLQPKLMYSRVTKNQFLPALVWRHYLGLVIWHLLRSLFYFPDKGHRQSAWGSRWRHRTSQPNMFLMK